MACGRRWGKTVLGVDRIVRTALDGSPAAWFAPEYKLLLEAWREVKAALAEIARPNEQEKRLTLVTGGSIDFWAFDNNPLAGRSRKYRRIIVDEAAHATSLAESWKRAIRPTLTDFRGDAWFLSSPNGRNEFARLFDLARSGADPEWAAFQRPTVDNPFIDPAEVESARRDMSDEEHRQEYGAEFLDVTGAAWFKRFDATEGGPYVTEAAEYVPTLPVGLGVDSGVWTGAVWFQVNRSGLAPIVTIFADHLSEGLTARENATAIRVITDAHCEGYTDWGYTDPAGGARNPIGPTVLEEYEAVGLRLDPWPKPSVAESLNVIERLVSPAAGPPRLLIHPRCRDTIRAFQSYSRARRAGQWADWPEDPQHPHEDLIDALRGAVYAILEGPSLSRGPDPTRGYRG